MNSKQTFKIVNQNENFAAKGYLLREKKDNTQ